MSSPRILSNKKNFTSVNDIWEDYYSENKFSILEDVQKALKYVPIYYQKKNLTNMAAAYSLWNGTEQRFEVFCPKNAVFRSTNLHELGHIYFGHLKNSRKYIAMAEKMLNPYRDQLANFFNANYWSITHDVINICMDFEINSKLFVTKKEREELNASVQFYLLRRCSTDYIRNKINNFDPNTLSKETIIYFPENFGFPGKKSFLEYVQMMIDFCINHKKPEIPQNKSSQPSNKSIAKGEASFSLPMKDDNSKDEDDEANSITNEEDNNNSDKISDMPSFETNDENKSSTEDDDTTENEDEVIDEKDDTAAEDQETSENNETQSNENSSEEDDDIPQIEDVDYATFAGRFKRNIITEKHKDQIIKNDKNPSGKKNSLYDIRGENLYEEISTAEQWVKQHNKEEKEINELKEKLEIASNASEINGFILRNALPSIDIHSYNDILYNYNRGKTTDVFINKVRTRSAFIKPNVHIYTDVSGSMDPVYTKKIVKAVKSISSRIDNRSSITFYNGYPRNTEKFCTLTDEAINSSFVGGGTDLSYALDTSYVKTYENNSANTLVIISDFCDSIEDIKKSFEKIKSTIICIEVGNTNNECIADDFKEHNINNVKLLKVVNREYAA
jgi:hypothetical protein